jgi:hypothetical protein
MLSPLDYKTHFRKIRNLYEGSWQGITFTLEDRALNIKSGVCVCLELRSLVQAVFQLSEVLQPPATSIILTCWKRPQVYYYQMLFSPKLIIVYTIVNMFYATTRSPYNYLVYLPEIRVSKSSLKMFYSPPKISNLLSLFSA